MVLLGCVAKGLLHLGAPLLGRVEVAETLLTELESALLLTHTQELNHALLKRGVANEVSDDGLGSTQALVRDGIAVIRGRLAGAPGGDVALVEAGDDASTGGGGGHFYTHFV